MEKLCRFAFFWVVCFGLFCLIPENWLHMPIEFKAIFAFGNATGDLISQFIMEKVHV